MQLQHQTILITGGSSGIGLELARVLIQKKNTVIACGRSRDKLDEARKLLPSLHTVVCDISQASDCQQLIQYIRQNFPDCRVLINNAAIAHKINFLDDKQAMEKAEAEINTNLLAPILLSKIFTDTFGQVSLTIINVTTGLVFAPRVVYPFYTATKAGLHAFTQVLREQVRDRAIRVIEVMMPVVNTPWHKGDVPRMAISPQAAVAEMIRKIENDETEIKVGKVWLLALLSRLSPRMAFRMINRVK